MSIYLCCGFLPFKIFSAIINITTGVRRRKWCIIDAAEKEMPQVYGGLLIFNIIFPSFRSWLCEMSPILCETQWNFLNILNEFRVDQFVLKNFWIKMPKTSLLCLSIWSILIGSLSNDFLLVEQVQIFFIIVVRIVEINDCSRQW